MKHYEKIEGTEYLSIQVDYEKGGMNYFNGGVDKRGYYLYVRRVRRSDPDEQGIQWESFDMFGSGLKSLLLEVNRRSDKSFQAALKIAEEKLPALKAKVLTLPQKV